MKTDPNKISAYPSNFHAAHLHQSAHYAHPTSPPPVVHVTANQIYLPFVCFRGQNLRGHVSIALLCVPQLSLQCRNVAAEHKSCAKRAGADEINTKRERASCGA